MKKFTLEFSNSKTANAGYKARADVTRILTEEGYVTINVFLPSLEGSRLRRLWNRTIHAFGYIRSWLKVPRGSRLLLQYPWPGRYWDRLAQRMLRLSRRRGIELVCLVHDLDSYRYERYVRDTEVNFLNSMDLLIVHTDRMQEVVRQNGIKTSTRILRLFDYLADESQAAAKGNGMEVVFAGNLDKSEFIGKLLETPSLGSLTLNLYGITSKPLPEHPNVKYMGVFDPDDISAIRGDWGLVWDGDSVDTCGGAFGHYLRINSSHKASLYIAAGIPVIVWSESGIAPFVKENSLGICVNSLSDIEKTIQALTSGEMETIRLGVKAFSSKLKRGDMLRAALPRSITFLLPCLSTSPIGGFKVIYEYGNRLAADGYRVRIAYPFHLRRHWEKDGGKPLGLLRRATLRPRFLLWKSMRRISGRRWFALDERVKEIKVLSLREKDVPASDIYVATSVKTPAYLNDYKEVGPSAKFYLIQSFEAWGGVPEEYVLSTYRMPLRKIVISRWLEKIVQGCGQTCEVLPNGFDFNYFRQTIDFAHKDRYRVAMLYHTQEIKGVPEGLKALAAVKERYPQLEVNLFGVPDAPAGLPEWYHYYQLPDRETHNRIYNEASIFLGTSRSEGWGLTLGEAMICGCAVVCTDNPGYLEMVTPDQTALVSPVKDSESLAANMIRLIEDDSLRLRIARAGHEHVRKFTWESSVKKLERMIEDAR